METSYIMKNCTFSIVVGAEDNECILDKGYQGERPEDEGHHAINLALCHVRAQFPPERASKDVERRHTEVSIDHSEALVRKCEEHKCGCLSRLQPASHQSQSNLTHLSICESNPVNRSWKLIVPSKLLTNSTFISSFPRCSHARVELHHPN